MLDIKRIRQNPEALVEAMRKRRNKGADVTALLELDAKRREVMQEVEQLKAKRNEGSAKVPAMKKAGEDTTALMAEMKELGARVKELDDQIAKMDEELQSMLMSVPNIPHESVPEGADDKANVEVRRWSEPTRFDFEPKAHGTSARTWAYWTLPPQERSPAPASRYTGAWAPALSAP